MTETQQKIAAILAKHSGEGQHRIITVEDLREIAAAFTALEAENMNNGNWADHEHARAEAAEAKLTALSPSQPTEAQISEARKWVDRQLIAASAMMKKSVAEGNGYANFAAHDAFSHFTTIKAALSPTSEPGTRGQTLAETDAANAEAGARAIQAIIGEPDTQGPNVRYEWDGIAGKMRYFGSAAPNGWLGDETPKSPQDGIADAVIEFLVKHEFLDARTEYDVSDVIGALDDNLYFEANPAPQVDAVEVERVARAIFFHGGGQDDTMWNHTQPHLRMTARDQARAAIAALRTPPATDGTEKPNEAWKSFAGDFNAMTDSQIERESERARRVVDEQESWLEAVASWEAAGKPRATDGTEDGR